MDNSSQWPQGFGVVKPASTVDHPSSSGSIDQHQQKKTLARPQKDQIVNCPRCNSVNTKFCYYNNYSLSQPRYFCKTCRRYWTAGGSLRNVPVGGGSRKNRRSSSSSLSSASATSSLTAAQQAQAAVAINLSSSISLQQGHQDLNLSFPPHLKPPHDDLHRHQYPNLTDPTFTTKPSFNIDRLSNTSKLLSHLPNPNSTSMTPLLPPMGLFKNNHCNESREMMRSIMMNSQHHTSSASIFSSAGFPQMHQDQFKPSSLNFSLDGFSSSDDGYASSLQLGVQQNSDGVNTGARLLFPFNQNNQNLNKDQNQQQVPTGAALASSDVQFDLPNPRSSSSSSVQGGGGADGSSTAGFWTGMLSGGSW